MFAFSFLVLFISSNLPFQYKGKSSKATGYRKRSGKIELSSQFISVSFSGKEMLAIMLLNKYTIN